MYTLCIEKKSKHRFSVICSLLFSTTNHSNLFQFPLKFRRCAYSTVVKGRMNGLVSSETVYVPQLDWFIDQQDFAVILLRQYLSPSSAFFLLTCSLAIWSTKSSPATAHPFPEQIQGKRVARFSNHCNRQETCPGNGEVVPPEFFKTDPKSNT